MKFSGMKVLVGALTLLAVGSVPMAAQEPTAPMTAQEKANLKFVMDWWREVIISRHVDLAPKYQAEDYYSAQPQYRDRPGCLCEGLRLPPAATDSRCIAQSSGSRVCQRRLRRDGLEPLGGRSDEPAPDL